MPSDSTIKKKEKEKKNSIIVFIHMCRIYMHGLMEGKYIMVKAPCLNNSSSSINLKNWNIENLMSFAFV